VATATIEGTDEVETAMMIETIDVDIPAIGVAWHRYQLETLAGVILDRGAPMSARRVGWLAPNLGRMVQGGRRGTLTNQQLALTEAMAPIGPMEIARTVAPGREGIARFPTLICHRDEPEQPSGRQAFRLMANCGALVFGMDARHVVRNFLLQLEARERLRPGPLEWLSVPPELTVKLIATVALGAAAIEAIARFEMGAT